MFIKYADNKNIYPIKPLLLVFHQKDNNCSIKLELLTIKMNENNKRKVNIAVNSLLCWLFENYPVTLDCSVVSKGISV